VTLILAGQQLDLFLGCMTALVLLGFALGACGRYGQGYEQGWADAARPRSCRRCRAAELADTQVAAAIDLDMLEAALEIVERQQAQAWAADPVLRGRLLELEITRMADVAEERIGRLRLRPPRNPAGLTAAGALGAPRNEHAHVQCARRKKEDTPRWTAIARAP
jgi:hypothetical protein